MRSWARRSFADATSSIARVILRVLRTESIRRLMSRWVAIPGLARGGRLGGLLAALALLGLLGLLELVGGRLPGGLLLGDRVLVHHAGDDLVQPGDPLVREVLGLADPLEHLARLLADRA